MAAALQLAPITWVRSKSTSQNPLDTPSWRVNMTQGSSSCDELRKWCGPCCLQKAAHAGRGVAALRRRLAQPQATLHVSVVGNSVARFNNFGVARGFVHELRRRFPATKVTIEYAHVAGGFEPDHLFYCGLFAQPAAGRSGADPLPRAPRRTRLRKGPPPPARAPAQTGGGVRGALHDE
jgi:hypothetical protein